MTTMIERVARAMENALDVLSYEDAARAAIQAMREPTDEMLDAFWNQTGESREMRSRVHSRARRYHEAMIDAALQEHA